MADSIYQQQFSGEPASFGRVGVLYGGRSAEREISLQSGAAVAAALAAQNFEVVSIDVGERAIAQIAEANIDCAFIALHGVGGEDGRMQALLEWLQIPYTGSGVAASALAMNKLRTKQVWQSCGLPTPDYQVLDAHSDWAAVLAALGGEAFVKPVHEGSSLGMSCVAEAAALAEAYAAAAAFDGEVLAEKRVRGNEFSVALLNGTALPPIGLRTDNSFYDFQAKYISQDTQYQCPCALAAEKERELRALAERAFAAVGCRGWGRVDFMQDDQENFFLLEVNTVPGMTSHSLVPMAARVAGLGFAALVKEILMGVKHAGGYSHG